MIRICDGFASLGRNFGNKLFTYSLGSILSETQNLNLYIPENSYIQRNGNLKSFPFGNIENKRTITEPLFYVCDSNLYEMGLDKLIENSVDKFIFLDGYFSKYEYVKPYKHLVKNIYSSLISEEKNENDIVIMLRDSNIDPTFSIDMNFYIEILAKENFDKLFISFDHYDKHSKLIDILRKKYNIILLDLDIIDLFVKITSFKKIIASQGTFSFWASYLSNAEKIYYPITKVGPNIIGHRDVNLIVDDESRYEHVYL